MLEGQTHLRRPSPALLPCPWQAPTPGWLQLHLCNKGGAQASCEGPQSNLSSYPAVLFIKQLASLSLSFPGLPSELGALTARL